MKRSLILFVLCLSLLVSQAKTVIIGTGTGTVSQTSMGTLVAGDILQLKNGTYSSTTFSGLSGIVIDYNNSTITGLSYVGNLTGVILQNGNISSAAAEAFIITGPSTGLRWYNFTTSGMRGNFIDASGKQSVYNGNSSTKLLLNCSISGLVMVNSGPIFQGSYGACKDFTNVVDSFSVANVTITNTSATSGLFAGASIYHLDAHDWVVTGTSAGTNDIGLVQINGNARVHSIYRNGGYGYIMRIINVGLDGVAESYLYNCIDVGSKQYGTIDTRVDTTQSSGGSTVPYCVGGNIHILNNTSGNKTQADNYTTALVIAGVFTHYKMEVRNNLCFNNFFIQSNTIFQINTNDPLVDTSNNQYYTSAQIGSVLVDQSACFLAPGSPAIGKGANTAPVVITDYAGKARVVPYDVGARAVAGVTPPPNKVPVANAGPAQTIISPITSVTLDGSASIDSDGSITNYQWVELTGPTTVVPVTPTVAKTVVNGLTIGQYVFQLTVTDNNGASSKATVVITVTAAICPVPPRQIVTVQTIYDANGKVISSQTFVQTLP